MMNNYLFSQGGSGTEYTLLNFDWTEGLFSRHQRTVNFRNDSDKFVYIFNNPIEILKSFERRNFLEAKVAVLNLQGDVSFKPPMNLDSIAKLGIDFFHFDKHFSNFMNQKNRGLFIKFSDLEKGWDEIEDFTGMKRKSPFIWKEKASEKLIYNEDTISGLKKIYSNWINLYDRLPTIFYNF